jgi:hypothetical protein
VFHHVIATGDVRKGGIRVALGRGEQRRDLGVVGGEALGDGDERPSAAEVQAVQVGDLAVRRVRDRGRPEERLGATCGDAG